MALLKSSLVRRKTTGRKVKKVRIRRSRVVRRRHRRYAGIRGAPVGTTERNRKKALDLVEKRRKERAKTAAQRKALLRSSARKVALTRVFKGRVYKGRKVKPGLKRRYFGRKPLTYKRAYYGRVVPPGLKRRFFGRKASTRPRITKIGSKTRAAVAAGAISPQSYINMF